jgi:hypothetical protein
MRASPIQPDRTGGLAASVARQAILLAAFALGGELAGKLRMMIDGLRLGGIGGLVHTTKLCAEGRRRCGRAAARVWVLSKLFADTLAAAIRHGKRSLSMTWPAVGQQKQARRRRRGRYEAGPASSVCGGKKRGRAPSPGNTAHISHSSLCAL